MNSFLIKIPTVADTTILYCKTFFINNSTSQCPFLLTKVLLASRFITDMNGDMISLVLFIVHWPRVAFFIGDLRRYTDLVPSLTWSNLHPSSWMKMNRLFTSCYNTTWPMLYGQYCILHHGWRRTDNVANNTSFMGKRCTITDMACSSGYITN